MAQLDKLSIMGVRSFDPNKQTIIKFYPVTLILGVNGAGKTTIIESLRYVTSGDAPPGTNNGRTWIHDPQLQSYSGTVRAQLRLKFKAADNIGTVVYRSLELITKRDRNGKVSQQFKTLDSLIKRDAEDGNSTTLGSRCAEIDREMLSLMDVSKAVLTNVVFCHQEDNCWPLSEGKVLKEKFDQIFGSMGYVKALAKVKAYRNKKVTEVRELRAIMEKHEEILEQKKRMEKELERVNEDMSSNKRERSVLEDKLKPIQEELIQLAREGESMGQVKTIVAEIKGQLQEKLKTAKKLEERVTDVFSGSLEDLKQQRETFSTDVNSKQDKVQELNNRLRQIQGELRSNNNRKDAIAIRRGKLEQQEENYKRELLKKENYLKGVSSELNIAVESDVDLEQEIYSFIKSEIGNIQSNLSTSSQEKEKNIETLTDEYDKLKTEKTKAEQTIKMKQETQDKRDKEMKEVLNMVNRVEKSACDVAQNSEAVIDAVKELKAQLSDDSVIEPIESKLSDLQISHSSLQDEVSDLKKIYRGLQRDCISDISQVKKEVKELDRQMADVWSKLEEVRDSLQQEQDRGNTRLQKLQEYKTKLDHLNENIPENPLSSTSERSFVDDVKGIERKVAELEKEKLVIEEEIAQLHEETAKQQVILRNFDDNEQLMILRQEIEHLNTRVMEEESKVSVKDFEAMERKRIDLSQKEGHLKTKLGQVEGKLHEIQRQIRTVQTDLRSPKYQKAEAEFKKATADLYTMEVLCEDLNNYYKVLDKAVSTYHVRKMVEINGLIDHYWRKTYQGNDIQAIKIVCDDEEGRAADKRKVYNYRVVMVKDDAEMDMRGRCSAGQKVLASLVIRIALSQIFAVNCPILTLDEPTTNLDKKNIEALVKAIVEIAEDQRGKLQMVIITHDHEFLKYINNELAEYYYEVEKLKGYSVVTRKLFSERE